MLITCFIEFILVLSDWKHLFTLITGLIDCLFIIIEITLIENQNIIMFDDKEYHEKYPDGKNVSACLMYLTSVMKITAVSKK